MAAPGVAAWIVLIVLPLTWLCVRALAAPAAAAVSGLGVMGLKSAALAAGIALASVVLGFVPGRLVGTASRPRAALFVLLLVPLVLPRYLLYYAWELLLSPTTRLGDWLGQNPELARGAHTLTGAMVLVLWYWPLAALLIGQGWRSLDADTLSSARLDAGAAQRLRRVVAPLLAGPLELAFLVCWVLLLSEFGTFHLAMTRTIGTELAVAYEITGSSGAVARAAWPLAVPAAVAAALLWRRSRQWSTRPAVAHPESKGAWRWTVFAALMALSLAAPVGLLLAGLNGLAPLKRFFALQLQDVRYGESDLLWSLLVAAVGALAALWMAAAALMVEGRGRIGRALAAAMQLALLLAMFLPGSLVAAAMLELPAALRVAAAGRAWPMVSAGVAARLAGLALIILRLARDARDVHLGEMASVDGASWLQAWRDVHLPRTWVLPAGALLLLVMLGMTELPATMVLLPAGVPNFAQTLINQMHYVRDQQVIASCLILMAAYALLAGAAAGLLMLVRRRSFAAPVLAVAMGLCLAGCGSAPSGRPKVLGTIGKTGRGPVEFIYPRAIDRAADGTLWVVDKTGRVQHLGPDGSFIGMFRMPEIEAGKPTGLSVGPDGNVWVADTHYHRVMVYSPAGKLVRQFGRFGQGPGCFIFPTDVAFADDGRVFVSEYGGNDRISVFTLQGRFLSSFGSLGSGPGQFSRPAALAADPQRKRLYVADAVNHRIAIYDFQVRLLGYIGSPGRGQGQLRYPYDLALNPDGSLTVCEYGNNRLQVFSPEGTSRGTYGGPGRELGQLAYPWGATMDSRRRAYIVDAGNNRLQIWQL